MLSELRAAQPGILEAIRTEGAISKETENKLTAFLDGFAKSFS